MPELPEVETVVRTIAPHIAGRTILHAEFNASKTDPVRLLQLWVIPRHRGLTPRWEQRQFTPDQRAGRLLPVVTATESDGTDTLKIDQDATIYVSSLQPGESVEHTSRAPASTAFDASQLSKSGR